MNIQTLDSGLLSYQYSQSEQNATWREIMTETDPVITGEILYTPKDNLAYRVLSDVRVGFTDRYTTTISANGKTKTFTAGICRQHDKTLEIVRKMYN